MKRFCKKSLSHRETPSCTRVRNGNRNTYPCIRYSHAVWKIWIQGGNSRHFCNAATCIYMELTLCFPQEVAKVGRWESNPVLEFKSNRLVPTALNSCRFNLQTNVIQEVKDNNEIRREISQHQTISRFTMNDGKYSDREHLWYSELKTVCTRI